MKLVFVSDNRTGVNWGCRATSIALDELLRVKNEIIYTIYREEKFRRIIWSRSLWLAKNINNVLHTNSNNNFLRNTAKSLITKFSNRRILVKDFVSFDIDKATDRFEKLIEIDKKYKEIENAISFSDGIVINGEGDFIQNPNRRTLQFLLILINYAKRKKKKAYLVNTIYSPCPVNGSPKYVVEAMLNEMRKCDRIFVRDNFSKKLLNSAGLKDSVTYVPDALFLWTKYLGPEFCQEIKYGSSILPHPYEQFFGNYNFTKPYICVSGSSSAVRYNSEKMVIASFAKLVKVLQKIAPVYLVNPGSDYFLEKVFSQTGAFVIPNITPVLLGATILANASILISGRYHPSIMASSGGTPLICFESNSHKMESLQELMQSQHITHYPMTLTNDQISEIADYVNKILEDKCLREKILRRSVNNSRYVYKSYENLTS